MDLLWKVDWLTLVRLIEVRDEQRIVLGADSEDGASADDVALFEDRRSAFGD